MGAQPADDQDTAANLAAPGPPVATINSRRRVGTGSLARRDRHATLVPPAMQDAKSSTDVNIPALLDCRVVVQGTTEPVQLRDVLQGKHTVMLFVRNGA